MPRFKLTVAYDGTDFHGWQKQTAADGTELRTVQGVLQHAVRHTLMRPVEVVGASRTDAGVHAIGQVAAFTADTPIPLERLPRAISARLPRDVQVTHAALVADDFDPIAHALRKTYRFSIAHGEKSESQDVGTSEGDVPSANPSFIPPSVFENRWVYTTPYRLDTARMNDAAKALVGEHDFASFAQIAHGRATTVRTIFACSVAVTSTDRCRIDVTGSGFLYNMVRIIAGTLVEVGRGRIEPGAIPGIIAAKDRRGAGPTLPPEGLCLMSVEYSASLLQPVPLVQVEPGTGREQG